MTDTSETTTMRDHAIAWWTEKGHTIPALDSEEWERMYHEWIDFAFSKWRR